MQSVLDIPGLEEFEVQQFLCWSHGQLFVLFGSQSGHAVTGLAGDSYSRAAGANNFPHLFQQYGGSVEIHFKNGFNGCLAGETPAALTSMEILPYLCASAIKCRMESREERSISKGMVSNPA